ncbi:hypothetical protein UlMin_032233 [Ulmus minor]
MDHKTWVWRRKSSHKTILAAEKVANPLRRAEEAKINPAEKGLGSDRSGKSLNEKLASVLLDSTVQEGNVTKDGKIEEKTITGKSKREEEATFQEVDEGAKGRSSRSDAELKECMEKLSVVQEEQEQKIRDAVMMNSREYEKALNKLEEKFAEASEQLTSLTVENSNLSKALLVKEKVIEDLNRRKSQADAEFSALMTRLDSIEKENAFLKYEFHMLEKEVQIRIEEIEYYRHSAEASQKLHLESVNKIAKLEQECQRLTLLARKRLPGPAGNMRSDVQFMRRNQTEMRRRKQSPTKDLIVRDAMLENSPESPSKNMNFVIEKLRFMEEENKALREILSKKSTEPLLRALHAQATSGFPGAELQLGELSKGQHSMELARCSPLETKPSMSSDLDLYSEDGFSSSESWAGALLSELEHFRNGKLNDPPNRRARRASDISLMDDFVEMEKLAIVSAETTPGNGNTFTDRKETATDKSFDWLQVVLSAMLKQKQISKRSLEELFEDIKIALGYINSPMAHEADNPAEADPFQISGYLTWNSPKKSSIQNSLNGALNRNAPMEANGNQHVQCNLSKPISKIVKLIEGINPPSLVSDSTPDSLSESDQKIKSSPTSADYFVRVFQWKRSAINGVLQRFSRACDDLLDQRANVENFVEELASALDWILNNYVTPQEAVSTRDKIKKHFGWQELRNFPIGELDMVQSEEQSLGWPLLASREDQDAPVKPEKVQLTLQEENSKLKDELKNITSLKEEMEAKLKSATEKCEALMIQLRESQQSIGSLQAELDSLKESNGTIEDQVENQKLINEDLDTQLTVAKAKLNEVFQKVSSLEVELEDKRGCCEELESTCLELQLQLESDTRKETPKERANQEEKQSQSGWEITTASAKLAECQETIVNLGKQLKALASPREAALLDKVFTTSATSIAAKDKLNKRSSLRDRMLAEEDTKAEILKSAKTMETTSSTDAQKPSPTDSNNHNSSLSPIVLVQTPLVSQSSNSKTSNNSVGALAIVPSKKRGGFDLLRKLLRRRKKGNSQKSRFSAKV